MRQCRCPSVVIRAWPRERDHGTQEFTAKSRTVDPLRVARAHTEVAQAMILLDLD